MAEQHSSQYSNYIWHAKGTPHSVRQLDAKYTGFSAAFRELADQLRITLRWQDRMGDDSLVTLMDGSVTLPNTPVRFYASSLEHGSPWHSDFIVNCSEVLTRLYARALFLFEFRGWAFVYCTHFRPLVWSAQNNRALPCLVWQDTPLLTALELPAPMDDSCLREILPIAAISRPVPLFPLPMFDQLAEPGVHFPFWAHPHWADALLHSSASLVDSDTDSLLCGSLLGACSARTEQSEPPQQQRRVRFADEVHESPFDDMDDEEDYFAD